jgi:NADH:ubiquinone oxidoreductase subunit E
MCANTATVAEPQIDPGEISAFLSDFKLGKEFNLINALQGIQGKWNYLPQKVLHSFSEMTLIPMSTIYGVATFYSQFHLAPRGKNIIQVCTGTACHVRGSSMLRDEITRLLGIQNGETTEDLNFTLESVNCIGACAMGPVIKVNDNYHGQVQMADLAKIINEYR